MINEISNANQLIPQVSSARVEEGSGDNVKEAFLALLQGIAGIIPQASSMHAHLPEMQRITDDRPQKSDSMNTPKEKQYSELPDESKNQTGTKESLASSSNKTELSKNDPFNKDQIHKSASEDTPVAKDVKAESKGNSTSREIESAHIAQEGKDLQHSIKDSRQFVEVKSNVLKEMSNKINSESKVPLDSGMSNPEEVLSTIENQLKHVTKEIEQVVSKAQASIDTSTHHEAKKSVSELHAKIEVLSTDNEESDDSLGKALFNMLVKADSSHAPDVHNMDANKTNLHNYMNAFTMQSLAAEGEIKSMLALKSEVESIITTAKNNLERTQAHVKTNGAEAGPRQQAYVDKVKEVIEKAVINKTTDSVTVKIDPPHLGEITVKVVQKGKEVYAKLTSESSEVEHTLRTRMHELHGVLQSLGFKTDEVHVSIGKDFEDITQFSRDNAGHENKNWRSNEERSSFKSQGGRDQGVKDVLRDFPESKGSLDEGGWVA